MNVFLIVRKKKKKGRRRRKEGRKWTKERKKESKKERKEKRMNEWNEGKQTSNKVIDTKKERDKGKSDKIRKEEIKYWEK